MAKPRVCYVVNSIDATSVPATIAAAIADRSDFSIELLAWFSAKTSGETVDLTIHELEAPRSLIGLDRRHYRQVKKLFNEYDLVQAHHPHSGSFAKIIANRVGLPSISREGNVRCGFTRKGRIANGLTNPLSRFVVCNSQAVYNSFTRWERLLLSDEKIKIIPNGVDFDRIDAAIQQSWSVHEETSIHPDSVLVGTASIFSEQKALEILIYAIELANKQSTDQYELILAGDGPLRDDLEQLTHDLDIASQIHFLGLLERDHVYKLMDEIDIYAMPSRWEGFANAAVEALGVGNACVFTAIDSFTIPYESVSLFHPVDDAAGLADRLIEFGEDPELRASYRDRGRELVRKQYALSSVADAYIDLYDEALDTAQR